MKNQKTMLELTHLKLDGFLSYDKLDLPLNNEGITFIKGASGSGKSAIFEAISYLLLGETIRKKSSVKDLINKVLKAGYDIQLDFLVDGVPHMVREVRGRTNDDLYFQINGKDQRGKTALETRKRVISSLKMTADDFKNIAFLGQRQSQTLLEGTSGERAEAIVQIFGLDRYNDFIERCDSSLQESLKMQKDMTANLAIAKEDLISLTNSLSVGKSVDDVSDGQIECNKKKISDVESKLAKIRDLLTSAKEKISRSKALEMQKDGITKISGEISYLENECNTCGIVTADSKELNKELTKLTEEKAIIQAEIKQCRATLEEIDKLGDACPITKETCPVKVPITFKNKRNDDFTSKLIISKKKFEVVSDKINGVAELKEQRDKFDRIVVDIENKKRALENYVKEEIPDISGEEELVSKCLDGIERGTQHLKSLQDERTSLLSQRAASKQYEEFVKKAKVAIDSKKEQISSTEKKLEEISIENQYLSGALSVLKKTKMYKIDLVLALINDTIKEILSSISDGEYQAEFVSQKMDSKGKRSLDKLDIIVRDSYKELPIDMVSGGQATQVGLAILLAVWKAAGQVSNKAVNSLWIDEPFGPLSQDIVNRIFETVMDLSKDLGAKCVKVISHKELDPAVFDHVWNVTIDSGISNLEVL